MMIANYRSELMNEHILTCHFSQNSNNQTFEEAFINCAKHIKSPKVTKILIVLDDQPMWVRNTQMLWSQTRVMANEYGIKKWGVVAPNNGALWMTVKRLVAGIGEKVKPQYEYLISDSESKIMEWIRS